jgi:hypothetical protein
VALMGLHTLVPKDFVESSSSVPASGFLVSGNHGHVGRKTTDDEHNLVQNTRFLGNREI